MPVFGPENSPVANIGFGAALGNLANVGEQGAILVADGAMSGFNLLSSGIGSVAGAFGYYGADGNSTLTDE